MAGKQCDPMSSEIKLCALYVRPCSLQGCRLLLPPPSHPAPNLDGESHSQNTEGTTLGLSRWAVITDPQPQTAEQAAVSTLESPV